MASRHFDLGLQGSRPTLASYVLLAVAIGALITGALDFSASLDLREDALTRLDRARRRQDAAPALTSQAAPKGTLESGKREASASLQRRLEAPWDAALAAVEASAATTKGEVSLDSLQSRLADSGRWEVAVTARARSTEAALALVEAMNARPDVDDARLLDQKREQGDSAEVRFRLSFQTRVPQR
ncbi:hypothetical protein HHL11_06945 [Ramlibacter sp. G-1-2-2]|uniref:PilN domain-containing protein n=1 Tax=Ramlibacter agri TaxID=2728837 RepID=A0A848H2V6_9BURK|nr:hypothetical protein [Ramlibacter agri]NML43480.1 hypothetical protein [Ramlibacter agri]